MRITVRVTPQSRTPGVEQTPDGTYRIAVTAPAEHGRATDAARRALAAHLKVPPSRLSLLMGAAARTKVFELR